MFNWATEPSPVFLAWFGVVGTSIGILQIVIWIVSWERGRLRGIYYFSKRKLLVEEPDIPNVTVSIRVFDQFTHKVFKSVFLVSNRSNMALNDSDFVEGIFIPKNSDGAIFEMKFLPTGTAATGRLDQKGDRIEVLNVILPGETGFIVEVTHDGCVSDTISGLSRSFGAPRNVLVDRSSWNSWPIFGAAIGLASLADFILFFCVITYFRIPEDYSNFLFIPFSMVFVLIIRLFGHGVLVQPVGRNAAERAFLTMW